MDLDKETVQVVAIVCGTAVAVGAMMFDGSVGDAVGTTILTSAGMVAGYLFGKNEGKVTEDAKEIQVSDNRT